MRYAIVDIETTGLRGEDNRVTEIAILLHNGQEVTDTFQTLVNPQLPINKYVTALTGINDQMVLKAPVFEAVAPTILSYLENNVFVAHSVGFDYNVLKQEFKRIGINLQAKKLCTVRLSREVFPGLSSYSLGSLCSTLNIPINNRHRAFGDARATALLFGKILNSAHGKPVIERHLRSGQRAAGFQHSLPKDTFNKLPETPGVYYFKNLSGKIIYVGKAINIKNRVLGHFYSMQLKERRLCAETASIDYEETGSELLALLIESAQIKKLYPMFNTAQKRIQKSFSIVSYTDGNGILRLGYNPANGMQQGLKTLYSISECIAYLEHVCETFGLCPKYTQLQYNVPYCSHYKITHCNGLCRNEETVAAYNQRVNEAIHYIKQKAENQIITEKGRHAGEKAFILIKNGIYQGYGFVNNDFESFDEESLIPHIIAQPHNADVMNILQRLR